MRTYGETQNCHGCRYWSEMIAKFDGGPGVEAMCLASSGPKGSQYTFGSDWCGSWRSGHHGAIDDPPNYGEKTQALYRAEEENPHA